VHHEAPQRCGDYQDNDLDGGVDLFDAGCHPAGIAPPPSFPVCPSQGCSADIDGDGYSNEAEAQIGTDALGRCGSGFSVHPSSDWPSDLISAGIPNSTDRITILDLSSFLAPVRRMNADPGDSAFNTRWDVVPGRVFGDWINITDLTALFAGSSGYPPMFAGAKAFNGPSCSAHPVYGD
jgi:hypothetical protein